MIERCAGGVKLWPNKRCSVCDAGPGDQCAKAALRDWEAREAMRKALEIFADPASWRLGGTCDPNSGAFRGQQIAEAALKTAQGEPK